ncbi:S-adenosyl-L-methionine-dependent methyltransferase [Pyronema domesticum]|uniref:Similar to Probable methyltransferase C20orf7 homolog, mitochondrial acc. no. A3KP37 n=1 Tax=Pyronema omphalodes (strain CBS 100304) TaxID=1076935 RepID=U4LBF8_PYROM|nr:S-adenosyl-L-methionine-dependent methyltransferase [Pyronema domesticum]CCX17404.1 Similar to Probable methyltransferase C20orf7 homolog, mitochondrial; acc. no. A3KP37 [Pyronema omphalodes CBS 100304]
MSPRIPHHLQRLAARGYASASTAHTPAFQVFNRHTKLLQRERAAVNPLSKTTDYLRDHISNDLVERLLLINRHFPRVLDLGAGPCNIARALLEPREGATEGSTEKVIDRIDTLVAGELSPSLLHRDAAEPWNKEINLERVVLDEENLPFEDNSFDAIISAGSMHWINDLPHSLSSCQRILKPDAPFLAAMFGGDTLFELRTSLQLAEMERCGGVSPRVSPLADTRDLGGLLDKAGFSLLTIDTADVVIDYPDIFALMTDLQAMGEGNAVLGRKQGQISRDVLMAAEGIYRQLHGNTDDTLPATFKVIFMIGWKKSDNQPKPLARGSAQFSLKDLSEMDKKGKKE